METKGQCSIKELAEWAIDAADRCAAAMKKIKEQGGADYQPTWETYTEAGSLLACKRMVQKITGLDNVDDLGELREAVNKMEDS